MDFARNTARPEKLSLTLAFRRAVDADAPGITDILRRGFQGQIAPHDMQHYEPYLKLAIKDPKYDFTLAVLGQTVVGFSVMHPAPDSQATLDILGIDPDYQGQGIGKRLMQKAEETAARWNCQKLRLQVRADNAAAIAFYAAHQFRSAGVEKDAYAGGVAGVFMEKQIAAPAQHNTAVPRQPGPESGPAP